MMPWFPGGGERIFQVMGGGARGTSSGRTM